jgi:mannose-6-phosphate isomerase-like protein (cupin superfamily)
MQIFAEAGTYQPPPSGEPNDWIVHLSTSDLSLGTYSIPAGGADDQQPHTEDEIYVVKTGRATMVTPSGTAAVGPGSVIYVPAGEEHRFTDVTEDLALIVVFAPPYRSRALPGPLLTRMLPIRSWRRPPPPRCRAVPARRRARYRDRPRAPSPTPR